MFCLVLMSYLAFSITILYLIPGLKCWTCDNAKSDVDCMEKGELKDCHANEVGAVYTTKWDFVELLALIIRVYSNPFSCLRVATLAANIHCK